MISTTLSRHQIKLQPGESAVIDDLLPSSYDPDLGTSVHSHVLSANRLNERVIDIIVVTTSETWDATGETAYVNLALVMTEAFGEEE